MAEIKSIQEALEDRDLDGWLFYGFRGNDPIALNILGLDPHAVGTRRWFYLVPKRGEARGLVHAIEPGMLDKLAGEKKSYLSWRSLRDGLGSLLEGVGEVAMQYSPENHIPTVSRVDAGTIELVRSLGPKVVSSADLVQLFEARLSEDQVESHRRAAKCLRSLVDDCFARVASDLRRGQALSERTLRDHILEFFDSNGLETDHAPIAAVNEHSASPHFEVADSGSRAIREGDFLLLDMWAKEKRPGAVYADITWCGHVGTRVPQEQAKVFNTVRDARKAAVALCEKAFKAGEPLHGFEVDRAAREVIANAGYGAYFVHRTGHSIHEQTHGNGANMDDLETHDTRVIVPWTLFSIEPGIYLPGKFGVRSELNVLYAGDHAEVTGGEQQEELIPILEWY